ncbi:tyrosine-type recombinase/integrase [Streptomyces sioyaensis]|uniref:tyrosine-type recombinase/integrase n=1 Tax=Streptomyces sioyaensis TaxID=67364 RepID=UPI0033F09658
MSGTVLALPSRDPRADRLRMLIRHEFLVEVFFPPPGHFLGQGRCLVGPCGHEGIAKGMCNMHRKRWRGAGSPADEAAWAADPTNSEIGWQDQVALCRVPGCPRPGGHANLCAPHAAAFMGFVYRGEPLGIDEFVMTAEPAQTRSAAPCTFPGCQFAVSDNGLCDGHRHRWQRVGRPSLTELPHILMERQQMGFPVRGLPPLARLEFQYLLQVRTDARRTRTLCGAWKRTVKLVAGAGVDSVRDREYDDWCRGLSKNSHAERGLMRDLLQALEELDGPKDEFERDVWRPSRLGYSYQEYRQAERIDFTAITQTWLREKAKLHTRQRMNNNSLRTLVGQLRSFRAFSRFLRECVPDRQDDPQVLDRPLLERYVSWQRMQTVSEKRSPRYGLPLKPSSVIATLSPLAVFLDNWHWRGWQPELSRQTRIYPEDYPIRPGLEANFIDEYLMEQIETEENIGLLAPMPRTIVLIARDEGMRIGEVLTLPPNCLKKTAAGRWALVHYKTKDQSWRSIPASALVVEAITAQRRRVRAAYDGNSPWLFPRTQQNPDGMLPVPYKTACGWLYKWLRQIDLVDHDGHPTRVKFHQFRHTLGTRMANAGVSGRTIREVLGHTSWEMQEHYSRISDETLRREYQEKYEVRFNLKGEAVRIRPDSNLEGIQWMAEQWGRRLHAVAGGWCGRHISRPCPKTAAEGCYECPDFQTDATFLPVHADTLRRTRMLQDQAAEAGRDRVAALNEKFAGTVTHLIERISDEEKESLARQLPAQRAATPTKESESA